MATITTRSGKGSALTHTELDDNFSNLNSDKAELSGADFTGDISVDGDVTLTGVESTGAGAELTFTDDGSPGLSADIKFTGSSGNGGGYAASLEGEGDLQYSAGGHLFADNSLVSGGVPVAYYKLNTDHRFATNYIQRMLINNAGNVYLYEDTGASAKMIWNASAETLEFADNVKANFGSAGDLQIFHDSNNSFVKDAGTGDLYIAADNLRLTNSAATEFYARGISNGAFSLYYDGSEKLATTSTGVDVTGTVTADGLTVDGNVGIGTVSPSGLLHISAGASGATPNTNANDLIIESGTNAGISILGDGNEVHYLMFGDAANSTVGRVLYDHNSDHLALWTNGSEAMRIDSSGRVGIGTTTPATTLTVEGSSANGIELNRNGADAASSARLFFDSSTNCSAIFNSGGNLVFATGATPGSSSGTERMRLDSSGRVGIGTSSPQEVLHIAQGASVGTTTFRIENTETGIDPAQVSNAIEFYTNDASAGGTGVTGKIFQVSENSGTQYALGFSSYNGSALSEAMRIDSSGNVGIGGSTPSEKLEVSNGSAIDAGEISIKLGGDVDNSARTMTITKDTSSPYNTIINTQNNTAVTTGSLVFKNGSTEQMHIDSSGNLLLGKTSASLGTSGAELKPDGIVRATRNGYVAEFNRITTDGEIVNLKSAGSTVGSIGASTGYLYIGDGDTNLAFSAGSDLIFPRGSGGVARDAAIDLGNSSNRFKNLYLSGGVYLGGTGAANQLDDYEEGTFTVAVEGSTTAGTGTYATRNGRYTKIGNVVHVRMYINMSAHTGAGNLLITGLPFNAKNAANEFFTASIDFSNGISKTADNYIYGLLRPNTSQIEVQRQPTSGTSTVWNLYVPLDTSFQASLSLTYVTD